MLIFSLFSLKKNIIKELYILQKYFYLFLKLYNSIHELLMNLMLNHLKI
jgi:hypothetical protein